MPKFRNDLAAVLNRYSRENGSNTPDFILAEYLEMCLAAFDATSRARERWYGKELRIGGGVIDETPSAPPEQPARDVVSRAMDALESDATLKQRRDAWNELRDTFFPIEASPEQPKGEASDGKIRAPFTPSQVARLTEWQTRGTVHPFTCVNQRDYPHPPDSGLVPTVWGWECQWCPYTQNWAHSFMVDAASVSPPPATAEPKGEAAKQCACSAMVGDSDNCPRHADAPPPAQAAKTEVTHETEHDGAFAALRTLRLSNSARDLADADQALYDYIDQQSRRDAAARGGAADEVNRCRCGHLVDKHVQLFRCTENGCACKAWFAAAAQVPQAAPVVHDGNCPDNCDECAWFVEERERRRVAGLPAGPIPRVDGGLRKRARAFFLRERPVRAVMAANVTNNHVNAAVDVLVVFLEQVASEARAVALPDGSTGPRDWEWPSVAVDHWRDCGIFAQSKVLVKLDGTVGVGAGIAARLLRALAATGKGA